MNSVWDTSSSKAVDEADTYNPPPWPALAVQEVKALVLGGAEGVSVRMSVPLSPRLAERPPPFPFVAAHLSKVTPVRERVDAAVISTAMPPPSAEDEQAVKVVKEMSTAQAAESER